MATPTARFSKGTIDFILKANRQKRPDWLDRNREDYERYILNPLQGLAQHLKTHLGPVAPGYHFPQKGLGRMKRSAARAEEYGALFRDYITYNASRPAESRFDHNPNLYFMIYPPDEDGDKVLIAGGLYMPSSRQVRAIREAIAQDATPFDRLFASKAFASRFPGGFSREKVSSRPPRGFDKEHPRMDWLKLQAFFVWRPYTLREFASPGFFDLVTNDCKQILRLNELLELALQGRLSQAAPPKKAKPAEVFSRLDEVQLPQRKMDF